MPDKIRERAAWVAKNVLPHEHAIRGWLARHRPGDLDVDDIIQETYARIVSLESFDAIRDPKRYVFQVAHSVVIDHFRRSRIVSILAVGNVEDLGMAGPEPDPEQRAVFNQEINAISMALSDLPERTRDVLMMRRVAGFSQRETAERLGISEKVVEKQLAKGVLMLMKRFGRGGKTDSGSSKGQAGEPSLNKEDGRKS